MRGSVDRGGRGVGAPGVLLAVPLLVLLALPVAVLLARVPWTDVVAQLADPLTHRAIGLTLGTTLVSLVVVVALGTPVALWLDGPPTWVRRAVSVALDIPIVLPPAVAGLALLLTFGRNGPVGRLLESAGLSIAFTPVAVVLAQVFVAAPYLVRAARAGIAAVEQDQIDAARADGAGPWARARHLLLPQALPSLLAGAIMAWCRAVGEFGATIIFAGNYPGRTQTMPLAVYVGFETSLERALVLSAVLIGMALLVLAGARLLRLPRGV